MSQTPNPSPAKNSTPVKQSSPLSSSNSKSFLLGKSDNFFVIHNELSKQRKKIIKYETKMEEKERREYSEKVFEVPKNGWISIAISLTNLKEMSSLMRVNSFFCNLFKDEITWKKIWYKLNYHPQIPPDLVIFNDSSISYKYKVKYCTNHIMKAGTVRVLADSIFFRSWEERYIILSGRFLYIYDISIEQTRKLIIENISRLSLDKILPYVPPTKAIDLRTVILVHQQAFEDGFKVFGFKNIDEPDGYVDWMSIPQVEMGKLTNWFRVLFLYADSLKLDLKTKTLY